MSSRAVTPVLLLTVAPWSALGAGIHATVFSVALLPPVVYVLRPGWGTALALVLATPAVLTVVLYRLLAPGGLRPSRAKLATGMAVAGLAVATFCAWLVWYWIRSTEGSFSLLAGVLGVIGLAALVLAVGSSLEAVVVVLDAE